MASKDSSTAAAGDSTPAINNSKQIGNMAHIAILANTAIFACAVVLNSKKGSVLFDDIWIPDGFCVSNKDVPYWNSHDLCLYFDTIGSIVTGILYLMLKDVPGMGPANDLVKFNVFGIFAHGLAHGSISQAIRDGTLPENTSALLDEMANDWTALEAFKRLAPLLIFWMGLLKASMPATSLKIITPLTVVTTILNMLVPAQFAFTFVQTILLFAFSLNQLMRPLEEKTVAYARYPLYVGLPLSFIGWLESTQCENFVIKYGGHLLYDAYIPLAMITFYVVCYMDAKTQAEKKVKTV
mmetsp:Transcript_8059/g.11610  ORF Transcript_8059/g.11610 Transcript_8059/m.11610 type:complete len:296 (-) Transcript_8059:544-1431(-)